MLALALALLAAPAAQTTAPKFRAVVLESMGVKFDRAMDINDLGEAVGAVNHRTGEAAAYWNVLGELTVLGRRTGASVWSAAFAINGQGVIVGAGKNHAPTGVLWTLTGGGQPLPWGDQAMALGVNDAGTILLQAGPGQDYGVLLKHGASPIVIDFSPGSGQVWALGQDGRVTGWRKPGQAEVAFRWSELGGFEDLPTPVGFTDAGGMGIAPDGTVSGSVWNGAGQQAALWDPSGIPTLLPQPALDGLQMGGAMDVNSSGTAVGWAYGWAHERDSELDRGYGLLWVSGAVFELEDLIREGPQAKVLAAHAINASGQIAAQGLVDGQPRALRLDPL